MAPSRLDLAYKKLLRLLEGTRTPYLIIGGLAVGVLGEPRLTQDIDIIAVIRSQDLPGFLAKAEKEGFQFHQDEVERRIKKQGTFSITYKDVPVDIILASTELEESALKRKRTINLFGVSTFFPTPEDLILLKIIPGRPKDLVDVESIVIRHSGKLDRSYLERWAQTISDEAEDMRIWNTLKTVLGKTR